MKQEMQQGTTKHTSLPWRIHPFRTSFSDNKDVLAIRCVGKSMTGRDWTSYIENEEGVTVLQTDKTR